MAILLIYLSILVIVLLAAKALFQRIGLSPIVIYLILGWVASFIPYQPQPSLAILAEIGLVLLLFHIGLAAHLPQLLRSIKTAGVIAFVEIALTLTVCASIAYLFDFSLFTSLLVGVALSATSIGVSTSSWREKQLTETKSGATLVDVAMIDDVVSIILMVILFGLFGIEQAERWEMYAKLGLTLGGLLVLIAVCYIFSHFMEPLVTNRLIKYERMPDAMLTVVGIGLLIAGGAAAVGFSFAIGAFFAGIAFSRDRQAGRMHAAMEPLINLFIPFFFFWIGYKTQLTALGQHWIFFVILLLATLATKYFGNAIPAKIGRVPSPSLIGVSMLPRAEVTMVVVAHGLALHAITTSVYSIISCIVLITCLLTPVAVKKFAT